MPTDASITRWEFVQEKNGTWTCFAVHEGGCRGAALRSFPTLSAASEYAMKYGFDPVTKYWTATSNGQTTHYRPGKSPVNLPIEGMPKH